MRKLFKTAILGVSALALPFVFAATVNADTTIKEDIDTSLEYQTSTDGSSMRFISTIVLNNDRTLDNITNIELYFDLSKDGEETKRSKTTVETKVYEEITGENGKSKANDTYYSVFKITDLTKNYTGWSITPYFKYNYSDNSTETVTASSWIIGLARLYFIKDSSGWGDSINVYMFENNEHNNANWPGATMNYDSTTNMYYYDYALGERFNTVIFNDGSNQTADEPLSAENPYYLQDDHVALPHPTAAHGETIQHDDDEHWKHCSTCEKNYEYEPHNLVGEDIEIDGVPYRRVTCSECDYSAQFNKNIVYFTNDKNWENVFVHRWGGTGETIDWPGVNASRVGVNKYNQEIYAIDVTGYEKIIFNNGNGWQTVDIVLADLGNYNSVYFESDNYHVGYYLHIA